MEYSRRDGIALWVSSRCNPAPSISGGGVIRLARNAYWVVETGSPTNSAKIDVQCYSYMSKRCSPIARASADIQKTKKYIRA